MGRGAGGRHFGAAAWLTAATLAAGAFVVHAEEHAHWSYSGATGPEHWASEDAAYATCGSGKHQSPIDIEKTSVESLPPIEFAYKPIALTVTDTGHSFQVHKNAAGDLAVVAVLIHPGEPNAFLNEVFDHFPPQGTSETKVPGTALNLGEFLPQHRGYYTFDGSLTTPPCTEHVRWFVLKSPVQASAAQVQQFAARYPHDARPVQALNDRTVKETRD